MAVMGAGRQSETGVMRDFICFTKKKKRQTT